MSAGNSKEASGSRDRYWSLTCAICLGLMMLLCHEQAFAQSSSVDIRTYSHPGIQKLIALDVLRASRVLGGDVQLVVGSRFLPSSPKSKAHLAATVYRYLRNRNVQVSTLFVIDGRTGARIATYSPDEGFRPK